jgi:hypothetical protein
MTVLKRLVVVTALMLTLGVMAPGAAEARQDGLPTLRVYVDCGLCDYDYLRQHVGFVDYVRDRNVADLHLLVLTQTTGGGGRAWTLMFVGYDRFRGQNRTLEFVTPRTASADDQRREFARVFRLGLVTYAGGMALLDELDVTWRPSADAAAPAARRESDGWNHWVFRLDAGGDFSGERRSRVESYRYAVSASRVTEGWKLNLAGSSQTDRRRFEFDGEEPFESERESWGGELLLVRSLGAHWALGTRLASSRSSFANTNRSSSARAGIEVDAFPYRESSRRSLTVQYTLGADRNEYRELTIYDKLEELIPTHEVDVSAGFRQPWGALTARSTFSQQIEHPARYRATLWGSTDVQVFSGFSFVLYGEYSRIRDQVSLPKAGASREEVLLRLQELQTGYSYLAGVGVSYSFGSIFNGIVNPRFARAP